MSVGFEDGEYKNGADYTECQIHIQLTKNEKKCKFPGKDWKKNGVMVSSGVGTRVPNCVNGPLMDSSIPDKGRNGSQKVKVWGAEKMARQEKRTLHHGPDISIQEAGHGCLSADLDSASQAGISVLLTFQLTHALVKKADSSDFARKC